MEDHTRDAAAADPSVIELAIDSRWDDLLERLRDPAAATGLDETTVQGRRALSLAAEAGCAPAVRRLVELGADRSAPAGPAGSLLASAVLGGCAETVGVVIGTGVATDLDRLDSSQVCGAARISALALAARLGHVSIMQRLLAEGASTHPGGAPPIAQAVQRGHAECLDLLMGASPTPKDDEAALATESMLLDAVRSRDVGVVRRVLSLCAERNTEAVSEPSVLVAASWSGRAAVLDAVLDARARVGAPHLSHGEVVVALSHAAGGEDATAMVATLLALGFGDRVDWESRPLPLLGAAQHGRDEACCMLLNHAGVLEALQANDRTMRKVLAQACSGGCVLAVGRLISAGAALEVTTAPAAAAQSGSVATLDAVVSALGGADAVFATKSEIGPASGALSPTTLLLNALGRRQCSEDMVRRLIGLGADPNGAQRDGTTALMAACRPGRDDLATVLLNEGAAAAVDDTDARGKTAIDLAAQSMDEWSLRAMLRRFKDAGAVESLRRPELVLAAARQRHRGAVHAVLDEAEPIGVNARDELGRSALGHCAGAGHPSAVRRLLSMGADIGATTNSGGTVLELAAAGGCLATVRLVLEAGGGWAPGSGLDIDAAATDGLTPLVQSARFGSAAMVDLLLSAGARADACAPGGITALSAACASLRPENVESVLRANGGLRFLNSMPEACTGDERVSMLPLSVATNLYDQPEADEGRAAIITMLFEHGADPSLVVAPPAGSLPPLTSAAWQTVLDAGPAAAARNFRWVLRRRLVVRRHTADRRCRGDCQGEE